MSKGNWPDHIHWVEDEDRNRLAVRLAHQVRDWLKIALSSQERASMAVSGGRTPAEFFKVLSRTELPWSRIDVTLADERWVRTDDVASNERLVRTCLLQNNAREARFIGLKVDKDTPEQGLELCEKQLALLHWPLDVVVLGMGNDGHTASLFPGTEGLGEALSPDSPKRCAVIHPLDIPYPRMSLTYSALSGARHQVLYLAGEDKLETLEEAFMHPDRVELMPVRAFLRQGLNIYWSP